MPVPRAGVTPSQAQWQPGTPVPLAGHPCPKPDACVTITVIRCDSESGCPRLGNSRTRTPSHLGPSPSPTDSESDRVTGSPPGTAECFKLPAVAADSECTRRRRVKFKLLGLVHGTQPVTVVPWALAGGTGGPGPGPAGAVTPGRDLVLTLSQAVRLASSTPGKFSFKFC